METDERDEKLVSKFVSEVTEIFDVKIKEAKNEFGVMLEQKMDVMNENLNTKIDTVIEEVEDLKVEVGFVKEYLMDNLEPRVAAVESSFR